MRVPLAWRHQPGQVNSLTSEPVVLKVVFNARTWMQVDFIQELNPGDDDRLSLSVAALGPISVASIVDIMHCSSRNAPPGRGRVGAQFRGWQPDSRNPSFERQVYGAPPGRVDFEKTWHIYSTRRRKNDPAVRCPI